MRSLQVVKTADGARWAVEQVRQLVRVGVEVHVCLPPGPGRNVDLWQGSGAVLHRLDASLPLRRPVDFAALRRRFRALVEEVRPDVIHSHFAVNAGFVRLALQGASFAPLHVFQVPGPLHLENPATLKMDLASASPRDVWIASSRYTRDIYRRHGVSDDRLLLSYYGSDLRGFTSVRQGVLRGALGLDDDALLVGNINFFYPPKRYLGQRRGVKNHEALLAVARDLGPRLHWVFIGDQWGRGDGYITRLREAAADMPQVHFLGYRSETEIRRLLPDLDLIVHAPLSENCGGVVGPMMAEVPVVAAPVGGLPELVLDQRTGVLARSTQAPDLARAIERALSLGDARAEVVRRGHDLVETMFHAQRTGTEVASIYRHLLEGAARPPEFGAEAFLAGSTRD